MLIRPGILRLKMFQKFLIRPIFTSTLSQRLLMLVKDLLSLRPNIQNSSVTVKLSSLTFRRKSRLGMPPVITIEIEICV